MDKQNKYRNNRSRWTTRDIRFIEQHYRTLSIADIATRLGRTPGAVALIAYKLGCRRKPCHPWTEQEKEIIRVHYAEGAGIANVMKLLPTRSENAIFSMAESMGIVSGKRWRKDELRTLEKYYPEYGTDRVARLLNRSPKSVKLKASRMGIRYRGCAIDDGVFRIWSQEEWTKLEKTIHLSVAEQMVLLPGRTRVSVEKARERFKKYNKIKLMK
ncbi:TPA: hypothetical protein H2A08_003381 [Salmonella enterica]|nr:hypothetical protein [Salmonella enterica]